MPEPTIIAKNISKRFLSFSARVRISALDKITFSCQAGNLLLLEGANGSGKSTLLRIIAGLVSPSKGSVLVFNNNPKKWNIQKQIGYLPENLRLHDDVSAIRFLSYVGRLKQLPNPVESASKWLSEFGINDSWSQIPMRLFSEGMRERTGLALVFMGNSNVLLLDEPLVNLDESIRSKTLELIDHAVHRNKKTIVVATHNKEHFHGIIDNILHLKDGKVW